MDVVKNVVAGSEEGRTFTDRKTDRGRDAENGHERGLCTRILSNRGAHRRPAICMLIVFGVSYDSHDQFHA